MTDIERCKTWVSDKTLEKIAAALDISPWELLRPAEPGEAAKLAGDMGWNEAVWRDIKEIKRRILLRVNKAIAEILAEYREDGNKPRGR
jgi:transcriptional regulator with XRE-family HTH domain